MMEYATIAALAISSLSPFLTKGLEKLAEKTAEEGFNERKAIWDKVKELFKTDDLTLLNLLETAQTDNKAQGRLEGKLETYLEADDTTTIQLQELLKKLPQHSSIENYHIETGDSEVGVIIGRGKVEGGIKIVKK